MAHFRGRIWKSLLGAAGMLSLVMVGPPWTTAVAQDEKGRMDDKALTALKTMSDYLGGSKAISFRARTFYDVVRESGIKLKAGRASIVSLKRPNQLSIRSESDDGSAATIWYDGSKLTLWSRHANEVMSLEFSGTTDKMLAHLIDKYDVQIPLSDLFYSDIKATFKDDLLSAEYVGIRVVDGVKCHQLSFESPGVDWQLWIEADATPVPRRVVMDFIADENKPQYMAELSAWSVDGEIDDYNFVAAVPESTKKIDFKLKP
jgi:hypothetical protein